MGVSAKLCYAVVQLVAFWDSWRLICVTRHPTSIIIIKCLVHAQLLYPLTTATQQGLRGQLGHNDTGDDALPAAHLGHDDSDYPVQCPPAHRLPPVRATWMSGSEWVRLCLNPTTGSNMTCQLLNRAKWIFTFYQVIRLDNFYKLTISLSRGVSSVILI